MKCFKFIFVNLITLIVIEGFLVSSASGIGISPARWTVNAPEFGPYTRTNTYSLGAPQTRYGLFTVYDAAGLATSITGTNAVTGVQWNSSQSFYIDWEDPGVVALAATSGVTVSIEVIAPNPWTSGTAPGTHSGYLDLVRWSDATLGCGGVCGLAAVVSQLSLWRNYAPRASITGQPSFFSVGELASIDLELEDFQSFLWWSGDPNYPWFSYEIDWDGNGSVDETGTATFDETPTPHPQYPSLSTWTIGSQTATVSIGHVYGAAGSYTAIVVIQDAGIGGNQPIESTTLNIPIDVEGAACGNSVVEIGETCDDGNTSNGDCCTSSCQLEPSGTECRASAGICDVAESCDGINDTCPSDGFELATTECRALAGVCDVAESCTGSGPSCPTDQVLDGVPCADGDVCNGGEVCSVGVCAPGISLDCDDSDVCTADSCDQITGCAHAPIEPCAEVPTASRSGQMLLIVLLMAVGAIVVAQRGRVLS